MAMNPMQRKANNYLLIGVLVTLLITGSIIAILVMQLSKINKQMDAQKAKIQKVYIVSEDIKSGEKIELSNLKRVDALKDSIPSNVINIDNLSETTISKIDLQVGTILTDNMIINKEEQTTSDVRIQEYNMIELPTQIKDGDYIDIRLRLSNGTDYIVISKKKVEIPTINGADSLNTIKINVAEEEILLMSNAIVEAYWATGSKLYATTYVEPGLQEEVTPTYLPSDKVIELMTADPNIVAVAKSELFTRYNSSASTIRGNIVNNLNTYSAQGQTNVESKVQEEINKSRAERQSYLDALNQY